MSQEFGLYIKDTKMQQSTEKLLKMGDEAFAAGDIVLWKICFDATNEAILDELSIKDIEIRRFEERRYEESVA